MNKVFYFLSLDLEVRLYKRKIHEQWHIAIPQIVALNCCIWASISPQISTFALVDFSASSLSSHPSELKSHVLLGTRAYCHKNVFDCAQTSCWDQESKHRYQGRKHIFD